MSGETVRGRLGRQIKDSDALRLRTLPLAVLASVVGTVLASAFGTGRTGALLSAAMGPLLTALFTTNGRGKTRSFGIALVTLVAVTLTVTGFTVPELIRGGKSLIADRSGTFVRTEEGGTSTPPSFTRSPLPTAPSPQTGPAIATSPAVITCSDTPVGGTGTCPSLDVRSIGTTDLQVTSVEIEGGSGEEFRATANCPAPLPPNGSCSVSVEFHPATAGPRQAVLVLHQNLSGPASRITLQGTGGGSPAPITSAPAAPDSDSGGISGSRS
jgi:hypothetical protein